MGSSKTKSVWVVVAVVLMLLVIAFVLNKDLFVSPEKGA